MGKPEFCGDGAWTKKYAFIYRELLETAGVHAGFQTNKAETDAPAALFTNTDPDTLKSGIIKRIHIRLNWANAVTLTAIRIYAASKTDDYESSMHKLYDSKADYPAGLTDNDEYDLEMEIPFILETEGTLYYAPEWSAACGNIQGYIAVEGETFE